MSASCPALWYSPSRKAPPGHGRPAPFPGSTRLPSGEACEGSAALLVVQRPEPTRLDRAARSRSRGARAAGGPSGHVTAAVHAFEPDLVICPFLKERVPAEVWRHVPHDHHPSRAARRPRPVLPGLGDHATARPSWGVTALQAVEEMDAGPIWGYRTFPMPADAAAQEQPLQRRGHPGRDRAGARGGDQGGRPGVPAPRSSTTAAPDVRGTLRPLMRQSDREFSWADPTAHIVRRIRAADGSPGRAHHAQRGRGLGVRRPPRPGAHRQAGHRAAAQPAARCWCAPATARSGSGTSGCRDRDAAEAAGDPGAGRPARQTCPRSRTRSGYQRDQLLPRPARSAS